MMNEPAAAPGLLERVIRFSVRRRWLVLLATLAVFLLGAWSLQKLPIDAVPDITNNQVQINTLAPNLSPVEMERRVTFTIEYSLAGIAGLDYTRSLSRNGFSQVTAVFGDGIDIYYARQQVMERLSSARRELPPDADPQIGPISTGLGEIYIWTVDFAPPGALATSPPVDGQPGWQKDGSYRTPEGAVLHTALERAAYLRTIQDWIIRPQIRTVRGIAGIDSLGGYVKQYLVQPDMARMRGYGVSFTDIARALESNNAALGAGYAEHQGEGLIVRSYGRLENTDDIGNVVISTRKGGVPIRVHDVADVQIGGELRLGSASKSGQEVVMGTALMLIGSNSRVVAQAVKQKLHDVAGTLPPSIRVETVLDRSALVDATIRTVARNLMEGAVLVIVVLFLLLGNLKASLITALIIPAAMAVTVIGMLNGGISANLMSLGALDFGLIVDAAVIITENTLRHLGERQSGRSYPLAMEERLDTITIAAREMLRPSMYGQAIIILVYIPLLMFSGVEGKMFSPMAMTVIIALMAAFTLSLTFVPAAIAAILTGRVQEKENTIVRGIKRLYQPALTAALAMPLPVIAVAAGLFAVAVFLFHDLGQEFIPQLDEGNIALEIARIPSTSLQQAQSMQLGIEKTLSQIPEVAYVFSKTGTAEIATDPMPPGSSDTFVILKPRDEWPDPDLPRNTLVGRLNALMAQLPGNIYEFSQPIQLRFNELLAGVRGDLAIKIFGDDFGPMLRIADQIADCLRRVPGAEDVRVEQITGLPFLDIAIDKAEIARRGLNLADVQNIISIAIGGRGTGLIFEGDQRFSIEIRLPDTVRANVEELGNLPVALPADAEGHAPAILLREIADITIKEGPNQVSRENSRRRIVVSANARGRDIGSIVQEAQAIIGRQIVLPPGYALEWGGQFQNLQSARHRLMVVVPLCFLSILGLLYAALGSLRDAALVFSAIPLALTGGVLALLARGMPFSISAAVGFIALSGIAVLNGLVMFTAIHGFIQKGISRQDAIFLGATTRLRPVVMTALVASLGFIPMAVATGQGSEVQRPIATVVIGGLLTATFLTLLVMPSLIKRFGGDIRTHHMNG